MASETIRNDIVKVAPKRKKKKSRGEIIFIICLLAWPIGHWLVFWLYVNLKTFTLPFMEWDYWESKYIINSEGLFANFKKQIDTFMVVDAMGKHSTVYIGFFNTFHSLWINLILLPLAIIIGYALAKHVPGEKIFRVLFFMPNIISTVVMCLAFRFMFEANDSLFIGPAAKIIRALGFKDFNGWDITNKTRIWTLIYVFCIWAGLSINVVLISSAFQRIPKDIIESARLDGVTFFQEFFHIGIPLIMPTVTTFLINAVIAVTAFYLQPYLLLNNGWEGGYETIPWIVFSYTQTADQSGYILIATIGLMFSAIMFPLIMLARFIGKKLTPDVEF